MTTDRHLERLLENQRAFVSFVQRRVGNRETAEDIVQDAFSRAITKAAEVRDDESVVAWFYRMLRNAIVDRYRRDDANSRALEAFGRELDGTVEPETHAEVCRCVLAAAGGLKPEYAEALRAVDVGNIPVKDFASSAGITPTNASVRLLRARQALRKQVAQTCGACATHGCMDCSCRKGPSHGDSARTT
jgi:RNA polymerase sigma-70 factor (ECF subfamily)